MQLLEGGAANLVCVCVLVGGLLQKEERGRVTMALAVSFSPSVSLSLHCSSPCGHRSGMFPSCFRYFVVFSHCDLCFCCLFVCEWDASSGILWK
jgi:hypothetical protein